MWAYKTDKNNPNIFILKFESVNVQMIFSMYFIDIF